MSIQAHRRPSRRYPEVSDVRLNQAARITGRPPRNPVKRTPGRQRGLTLIEISLVVAILGIVALSVLPNITPADSTALDAAAVRLANAVRFARNESIRTGLEHGILIDQDDSDSTMRDFVVYRVNPLDAADFSNVLYHPVSRQLFDARVNDPVILRQISIVDDGGAFEIEGIGKRKFIHFDRTGTPVYLQNTEQHRLLSGQITLARGDDQRSLSLDPVTGRVVIQ